MTRVRIRVRAVSFPKFKEGGRLLTHEVVRDAGGLTVLDLWEDALVFAKGHVLVFFSHQESVCPLNPFSRLPCIRPLTQGRLAPRTLL